MAQLVLILLLALAGCAAKPATVVVPREVKVPVPVQVKPPAALMACGNDKPGFLFYRPDDSRYSVALRPEDAAKLRQWVDRKQVCIEAWRALHR